LFHPNNPLNFVVAKFCSFHIPETLPHAMERPSLKPKEILCIYLSKNVFNKFQNVYFLYLCIGLHSTRPKSQKALHIRKNETVNRLYMHDKNWNKYRNPQILWKRWGKSLVKASILIVVIRELKMPTLVV